MASLSPISRTDIDAWPIANCGLSPRASNCLVRANVRNVGQLRTMSPQDLLQIRTLGRVSLRDIRLFLRKTEELEKGLPKLPPVRSVIQSFLEPSDLSVLEQRFGLLGAPSDPTIERMSLQTIGSQTGRTRERIRQCEQAGLERLRTRLARAYLEPFGQKLAQAVEDHDRLLTTEEALVLGADPDFRDYHPGGLLLLFCTQFGQIQFRHDFFSTLPQDQLLGLESELLRLLQRQTHPWTAAELIHGLARRHANLLRQTGLHNPEPMVERLLLQHPKVNATAEPAFFTSPRITRDLLAQAMASLGGSAHYRELAIRFNELLHPTRQIGMGAVLKLLGTDSRFERIERAHYRLQESPVHS